LAANVKAGAGLLFTESGNNLPESRKFDICPFHPGSCPHSIPRNVSRRGRCGIDEPALSDEFPDPAIADTIGRYAPVGKEIINKFRGKTVF
jgi:hypothetical protein